MNAFERATSGYDDKHERALADAIVTAIAKTSLMGDPAVLVLRLAEISTALQTVLGLALGLSPSAVRSPKAIREITDRIRRRLVKSVGKAAADPTMQDFLARCFRTDDDQRGGHA
jgi:hypothetical protein